MRFPDLNVSREIYEQDELDDYQIQEESLFSQRKQKKSPKKSSKKNIPQKKWTSSENQSYLKFLEENKELFKDEKTKRKSKVFRLMSDHMGNIFSPEQCRGHHKKKFERLGSIDEILAEAQLQIDSLNKKEQILEQKICTIDITSGLPEQGQIVACQSSSRIIPEFQGQSEQFVMKQMDFQLCWSPCIDDQIWKSYLDL